MKQTGAGRWFAQKRPREQILLLVGAGTVTLYLLWLLMWQPLLAARELSERRVLDAEQSLLAVQSLADTLLSLRADGASTPANTGNMAQQLDESASALGLRIIALEPSADNTSVSVRFEGAALADMLAWLYAIERHGRMFVDSLLMSPAAGGNQVSASVRVRSL